MGARTTDSENTFFDVDIDFGKCRGPGTHEPISLGSRRGQKTRHLGISCLGSEIHFFDVDIDVGKCRGPGRTPEEVESGINCPGS